MSNLGFHQYRVLNEIPVPMGKDIIESFWQGMGFEDVKKLGEGGYGSVYRVRDRLKHVWAVKVQYPRENQGYADFYDEKLAEVNAINEILMVGRQDYILLPEKVMMIHQLDKRVFACIHIMRLGEGILDMLLDSGAPLSSKFLTFILHSLLKAASIFSDLGMVHLDIKTNNVVLWRGDDGKLFPMMIDFSLSEYAELLAGPESKLVGSHHSPETLAKESGDMETTAPITSKHDIYCIGVLCLELLGLEPEENLDAAISNFFLMYGVSVGHLVCCMLLPNMRERLSARQLLAHPAMDVDQIISAQELEVKGQEALELVSGKNWPLTEAAVKKLIKLPLIKQPSGSFLSASILKPESVDKPAGKDVRRARHPASPLRRLVTNQVQESWKFPNLATFVKTVTHLVAPIQEEPIQVESSVQQLNIAMCEEQSCKLLVDRTRLKQNHERFCSLKDDRYRTLCFVHKDQDLNKNKNVRFVKKKQFEIPSDLVTCRNIRCWVLISSGNNAPDDLFCSPSCKKSAAKTANTPRAKKHGNKR